MSGSISLQAVPGTRLCKAGLHDLADPANAGTQRSTGRVYCRPCKRAYRRARRRERRPTTTLCRRGLHDLADPANAYVRPGTGRRECKPCKALAAQRRRESQAPRPEPEVVDGEAAVVLPPPGGVRSAVYPGGRVAAEYRLARLVRQGR